MNKVKPKEAQRAGEGRGALCSRCEGALPRSTSTDLLSLVISPDARKHRLAQWLSQNNDRFVAISYWAKWYESQPGDFWYLFEHGGELDPPSIAVPGAAGHEHCRVGIKGSRWMILDEEALVRAFHIGEILRGVYWQDDAGSNFYDQILQLALMGVHKYG